MKSLIFIFVFNNMKSIVDQPQKVEFKKLSFSDTLKEIVSDMSKRSQEIIFIRYGVFNDEALTLEEIGKKYDITRERVRQIVHEVLKKVREKKDDPRLVKIKSELILAIRSNSDIIEEKKMVSKLGNGNKSEKAAVRFFLDCVDDVEIQAIGGQLKMSYSVKDYDVNKWQAVKNAVVAILKKNGSTLSLDEMYGIIAKDSMFSELSKETLSHYLDVSEEIGKNSFGKWGIAKWKEISPKGTREKAYLILKEAKKPLHFRNIAKEIDKHNLNRKKTHPQTVHNELIKDNNFVLVGRGIYALAEWGYKKGTVKDVVEEILRATKKPLGRNEIIERVLKVRQVKKSTIVINLNNYFVKSKSGSYSVKK